MRLPKFRSSLALFIIISIAFVLRLFTLQKLMVFTPDEEYILYITQTLVKNFHVLWIGVSALGFDFYMGPGLEYFLLPFMWLSNGDPYIWGVITSVLGVFSTYLIYWLGKKVFNRRTALIAAFMYAASALVVYYDQQPYPTGVPLLSLGLIISIYMTKYTKKWWIVFAFLYGVVFHIHLSLILVIFVAIYWVYRDRKEISYKILLFSCAVFLAVIAPLIVFDFLHDFSNITAPIRVIQAIGKTNNRVGLSDRVINTFKTGSRLLYLENGVSNTDEILYPCNFVKGNNSTKINIIILSIFIVLIFISFRRNKLVKNDGKKLFIIYSFAFLVPYVFLPSIGSVEYYLLGIFPIIILFLASGVDKLNTKIIYLLVVLFFIYNGLTVFTASGDYGLTAKKIMVNKVMEKVGDSSFELQETGGKCQGSAGWGYLFNVYGRKPDKNTANRQFDWLIDTGKAETVDYKVIINETRNGGSFSNYKYEITEGGFTAYIY